MGFCCLFLMLMVSLKNFILDKPAPRSSCMSVAMRVLVKGSLGTRMAPIVEALLQLDSAANHSSSRPRAANGH